MPTRPMFQGTIPALVTPFGADGKVDEKAYADLIEWQIKEGSSGIVPCGTTGESPTLSHEEHMRVVEIAVRAAAGRVPVIAGTGSNATDEAIHLTQHAKKAGADAALVVTPYYNKPTQEGLYRHYKAIHDAADLPIVIYNIPGRCVIDMSVDTMARLAKLPKIVGVKDATNDLLRPLKTKAVCGEGFALLSGEDGTQGAFLAQGGHGVISVTANIAPGPMAKMHAAWRQGDIKAFQDLNEKLTPLHDVMFCETNPGPVKYALSLLGRCRPDVRLPLCELTDGAKQKVRQAMIDFGLIPG